LKTDPVRRRNRPAGIAFPTPAEKDWRGINTIAVAVMGEIDMGTHVRKLHPSSPWRPRDPDVRDRRGPGDVILRLCIGYHFQ
jgi:hypothetical protein